ncbi:hypothetical protein [Streptomyces sp. NPDC090080]|uniref:hypothetical protein n=1 Tax=Streptomyces sp. NPDC090080 TaxID=3365939 RepID=UPI0038147BFF
MLGAVREPLFQFGRDASTYLIESIFRELIETLFVRQGFSGFNDARHPRIERSCME